MKKYKAENCVYGVATVLTILGTGMAIAGLLLPYWVEYYKLDGIVGTEADIGLWQDRICRGLQGCDNFWLTDDDYDRPESFKFPKEDLVQGFETAGCALGLFTILVLIPLWATHFMGSKTSVRMGVFALFFTCVMISGFLCEIGVLILASEIDTDDSGWAPFLSGIGGGLMFIAGCMSCVVCRYDPTYGTLENPVSPTFASA